MKSKQFHRTDNGNLGGKNKKPMWRKMRKLRQRNPRSRCEQWSLIGSWISDRERTGAEARRRPML